MTNSGISVITAFAASFMRSNALRSFGFSNEYLLANLISIKLVFKLSVFVAIAYFVKPRPSILTTIHVFGRSVSGCSNCFTYSHLRAGESERLFSHRWDEMKRTLNLPCCGIDALGRRRLQKLLFDLNTQLVSLQEFPVSIGDPVRLCFGRGR